MAPTDLSRAITNEEWNRAVTFAKQHPNQAEKWAHREGFFDGNTAADVLPIHEALVANAPYELIVALVKAYPHSLAKKETSFQRLPLHCACRKNADPKVVEFLAKQYKAACLDPDKLERLPIHYALSNGADPEVVGVLMKAAPECARSYDHRGWTPCHVAVNVGASEEVVKTLLDAYPEVVLSKTNRGHSIRKVIPKQAPNRSELKEMVTETKEKVDEEVHLPSMRKKSLNPEHMTML